VLADPSNLFLFRRIQLLKSVDDGLDLERNAAEYMMALANLNVKPNDPLTLVCKSMAMNVLLLKDEDEETPKEKWVDPDDSAVPHIYSKPMAPVAVGIEGASSEPSRHPWVDKFPNTDERGIRHAVWPDIISSPGEAYHNRHPFREETYPLLRRDAITKRRRYVEHLKRMYLPSKEGEKTKVEDTAKKEKEWHDHAVKNKSPVVFGHNVKGKRKYLFGGALGGAYSSNHDLYERDFRRWKLENGHGNIDDSHDLRKEHFNSRADEWEGEDVTFEPTSDEEFSYDQAFKEVEQGGKKGKHHGHGLGWAGYMLGMEWLSPQERTAVLDHLENKGNVNEDSQLIKLPDGTTLPQARFAFNAMERMTPEINWWHRGVSTHSPNFHKFIEDNERDFVSGENRFLQGGLNTAVHDSEVANYNGQSIADVILERIHQMHDKYDTPQTYPKGHKNEGEQILHNVTGEPLSNKDGLLDVLPRFNFHNPEEWAKAEDSYDWNNVKKIGLGNHKTYLPSGKHSVLKTPDGKNHTKISKEDLLFLAGYHPQTEEWMEQHPMYGETEGPLIPKEHLDDAISAAKSYESSSALSKDIRNILGNKRSRFGPRPEENEDGLYDESSDGTHTTTHGSHWWEPFAEVGGVGRNLATYVEFIHHMMMDPETGKSIFGELDSNTGKLLVNKNLNSIASLVAPYVKPHSVEKVMDLSQGEKGEENLVKKPVIMDPSHVLSPGDITQVKHDSNGNLLGEGSSIKNNFTDHKSSTSGKYSNYLLSRSPKEHEEIMGKRGYVLPIPHMEDTFSTSEQAYGEGASDKMSHRQAMIDHHIRTALGHIRPFEEPQKKKLHNLKNMQSYGIPLSTGDNLDDFLNFIGYSDYRETSLQNPPNIPEGLEREYVNSLGVIARHLGTRNPHQIAQYLNDGDYTDLPAIEQENVSKLMNELGHLSPDTIDQETPKEAEERFLGEKKQQLGNIQQFLGMGAYGASLPEEIETAKELMIREQQLDKEKEVGEMSPEGILNLQQEIKELRGLLFTMQTEASNMQPKSKSGFWEDRAKQRDAKLEGDNNAITQMMKILLPQIKEAVPHSFPEDDKMQFTHDMGQLAKLAERSLLMQEHNSHGLHSHAYGVDDVEIPNVEGLTSGSDYAEIANHLLNHGAEIHGNMTDTEALELLGLPTTPKHKEHVNEIIRRSNEMNQPFRVASMHSLLTDGNLPTAHDLDLTPFHGADYHDLLRVGQKGVKASNPAKKTRQWNDHELHNVPRAFEQRAQDMFSPLLGNHGLSFLSNDLHGVKGLKSKHIKRATRKTQNNLDSLYVLNPEEAQMGEEGVESVGATQEQKMTKEAKWSNRPISPPTPESQCSVNPVWNSGEQDWASGYVTPTFDGEIGVDGNWYFAANEFPTLVHPTSDEMMRDIHGNNVTQIMNLPGVTPQKSPQLRERGYDDPHATDPYDVSTGEMTNFLASLLNPDVLLTKASEDDWVPLIRPMHRIFTLDDLKEFKGFSDSWVVSTWYEGTRLLLIKDNETLFLDENGKKRGVPKKIRDAASKLSDNEFIVDGVLKDDEFFVHDIISYDGTDSSDMNTNERLKILRGQLESHDGISIPGPYNTRVTDTDGLESAVDELKEEGRVLLRDAQSTYMKGEKRHPKWLILREGKTMNFVILDKRGKGPYTYRLGAGPILTNEGLGNRAVELDGKYYMDIGTAQRVEKPFEEGDIVEATISGVTKKARGGRDIFNVQITSVDKEGQGEGPASSESLSLLTKSYSPIIIPHDIDFDGKVIKIMLEDIDTVEYQVKQWNESWYLQNPSCIMGDLKKSNYSYRLSESLRPFWEPVISLMLKGYVEKMDKDDEINVVPKKIDPKRIERESAGVLDQKEKNILLKPSMVKALEVALRALDVIAKERMASSGGKGLGIDMATPVESPSGPTQLRDQSTLPDYDMRPRPAEDPEKPMPRKEKGKEKISHAKLSTNEGESVDFDIEDDQPTVRFS